MTNIAVIVLAALVMTGCSLTKKQIVERARTCTDAGLNAAYVINEDARIVEVFCNPSK